MAGTGTGACPSPRSRMSHTTRFSPDRSRRRAMKLLIALALASLPLPALAQAPAAADTDGTTAAGAQYVPPQHWTPTTSGPAVLTVSPRNNPPPVEAPVREAAGGAETGGAGLA